MWTFPQRGPKCTMASSERGKEFLSMKTVSRHTLPPKQAWSPTLIRSMCAGRKTLLLISPHSLPGAPQRLSRSGHAHRCVHTSKTAYTVSMWTSTGRTSEFLSCRRKPNIVIRRGLVHTLREHHPRGNRLLQIGLRAFHAGIQRLASRFQPPASSLRPPQYHPAG